MKTMRAGAGMKTLYLRSAWWFRRTLKMSDPRDPNWCHMHNMMWPACEGMH